MLDLRPIGYVVGLMIAVLGVLMLLPAMVDWLAGTDNAPSFLVSAFISTVFGGLLSLATRNSLGKALNVRQAFLLTISAWTIVPVFAALPIILGVQHASPLVGYFEAVSGITTTGSTLLVGLDYIPPGVNLWRGMITWLGGLGIAFVALAFLPVMRVGGMQFFRAEGFDTLGKMLPRANHIALSLAGVYVVLTVICILTYLVIGMSALDAVVNGMSSIATGGFSPADDSFTGHAGLGEYFGTLFMICGSLPYVRYLQMVTGSPKAIWKDTQVRGYLTVIAVSVIAVTGWRLFHFGGELEPTFRETLFNLVSIMSGTGFFSGSFATWGGFSMVVAFALGIIGGCSSSSSGALSVFRVQVTMAAIAAQLRLIATPSRIAPVKYAGRTVDDSTLNGIILYVCGYILSIGILGVAMTLVGVDTESAIFAAWTSLGNIGYGYGPLVAPTGTFVDFPDAAVVMMIVAMIAGRLALLSFFVLLLPRFWRG
ncbi:MAG: potassium transporter TrkH [Cereibacter sphaeroides]|uniref:Trk system potassium uptake protein n=1 Tax=Cereibacter sphaeroides TaxID=1063 RepID=A0A2W5SDN3_CERSP|nr:MAG: potassium transporter TrkH [Cereibacter sphaeroides]